ncbi:putative monovalent cation/H+ antiporter subunit E [Methanobrevibacter curvatus]|uniref:Putative monovalent cation/H+ antiporter subunit E n=2 Tax=Methanobrevibacter curvatus TaxID=49547 RepID=A0A166C5J0_9EURY|nr:putative monovalent cation/H+ antiporter subunit E [Methanobrevibacter curvatus]
MGPIMFFTRFYYGILYFFLLIFEIIKACFDTLKRCKNGEIDPVIIEIKTILKRPISQTILANSITLTPGTLTIDIDSENCILITSAISPRDKKDIIPFEYYIQRMLE